MPVDDMPNNNRFRPVLRLAAGVAFLFLLIIAGYSWWITRPVAGAVVAALPIGDGMLLAGHARLSMMPPGEMAFLPSPIRLAARAHRYTSDWRLLSAGEKSGPGIKLAVSFGDVSTLPPVSAGGHGILAAALPDRIVLLGADGAKQNEYVVKQTTMRSIAASADGRWAAFACSRPALLKTQGRQPGMDPYERQSAPAQTGAQTAYRLFVSDGKLNNVKEIDISGLYPSLGPGALAWNDTPELLFTGYVKDNHDLLTTYRVDPQSGSITPAPGQTDWGPVFALSPDGKTAAAVGSRGLTLTNTQTGAQDHIPAISPPERVLPAWRPDGKRVAFAFLPRSAGAPTQDKAPQPNALGLKIIVMDAALRNITAQSQPVKDFTCGLCTPYWSPDGERIFINGTTFQERRAGFYIPRHVVLCFDIKSQSVSFPSDFAPLWK
jgi:hypothetical protein